MALQKIKLKIGTVYQKEPNGVYYFRYQVNGARKAISLKTRNKQQAIKEAEKHVPLLQATSSEVIAAHVQVLSMTALQAGQEINRSTG